MHSARSTHAMRGCRPSLSPDAATISGDGVSPGGERGGERICAGQRRGNLGDRRWPLAGVAVEASHHHAFDDRIDTGSQLGRCDGYRTLLLRAQLRKRRGSERAFARVQFVEHEAKCVDVATYRGALAGELLRCHVRRRTSCIRRFCFVTGGNRQAEVRDTHAPTASDHDVRGLQISMQDTALVRGGETRDELAGQIERLLVGQIPDPLEQRCQILPVDVLHCQEVARPLRRRIFEFRDVVDAADVRMGDLAGDADFGKEPLTADRILGQRRWQELQRDRLSQFEVVGLRPSRRDRAAR